MKTDILSFNVSISPKYELPPPNWDDGQGARIMPQERINREEVY